MSDSEPKCLKCEKMNDFKAQYRGVDKPRNPSQPTHPSRGSSSGGSGKPPNKGRPKKPQAESLLSHSMKASCFPKLFGQCQANIIGVVCINSGYIPSVDLNEPAPMSVISTCNLS